MVTVVSGILDTRWIRISKNGTLSKVAKKKKKKNFANKKTESYLTQQDHVDLPDEPGPDGLVGERGPEALRQNNLDRTCLNIPLGGHTHLGQLQSNDKFRVLSALDSESSVM